MLVISLVFVKVNGKLVKVINGDIVIHNIKEV